MPVKPSQKHAEPTFCFVYEPAPGHSLMMSSLASLLVAKANATPENVVPCDNLHQFQLATDFLLGVKRRTYEIDTNDELSFTAALPFDLGSRVVALELLRDRPAWRRRCARRIALRTTKARRTARRGTRRTSHRRRTTSHRVHVGWRVAERSTSVDRGRTSSHLAWRGTILASGVRAGATEMLVRRTTREV